MSLYRVSITLVFYTRVPKEPPSAVLYRSTWSDNGHGVSCRTVPSAIRVPSLGTQMSPGDLRIAIALRTGSKVSEKHLCKCGKNTDEYGHHLLSCHFSEGRLPRHAALNDIIFRALKASGLPAALEPVGLDRGDGKRPDGISLYPFSQGRPLC